jgi:hypothetical protein
MLLGVAAAIYGISTLTLLQLLPAGPHNVRDYFIIGCLSTLVSLLALFLILIKTWIKGPNLFFKRRKR